MADKGNDKPAAFSPAFASLLNKNTTVPPKPNFAAKDQLPRPNFGLLKVNKQSVQSPPDHLDTSQQDLQSATPNTPNWTKSITFGTLDSQNPKTAPTTPFSNLINKNKETRSSFGTSALEKLSAKYLNQSAVLTPKFGKADIACPVFERRDPGPADESQAIRPLNSGLPSSPGIQIPAREAQDTGLATSAGSTDAGSPSAKFTFSPIPRNTPESKVSSLGKLKDRYAKNSRDNAASTSGSPNSPSLDENKAKRFNFDLSSALVARQQTAGSPVISRIVTPQRRPEHTIVVDQLACVLDARTLLDAPCKENAPKRKQISHMGRVICKKWKPRTCEDVTIRVATRYHIPAFKFDTMSPDDEIQAAKFKRRR